MKPGDLCHYFDTMDGDGGNTHKVGLRPCANCGVPICSSCAVAVDEKSYCIECNMIRGDEMKLYYRASEMKAFYDKAHKYNV